jgi:hypothetical protein
MNQKPKGTLEVSKDVVAQLNAMVRNSATLDANGQSPRSPEPPPSPKLDARSDYED